MVTGVCYFYLEFAEVRCAKFRTDARKHTKGGLCSTWKEVNAHKGVAFILTFDFSEGKFGVKMVNVTLDQQALAESCHSADIEKVLWHEPTKRLYTGADDGEIRVWLPDLTLEHAIQSEGGVVYDIAIIGDILYTACDDGTIRTFALHSNGAPTASETLKAHENTVRRLVVDNGLLYSGDSKGEVYVWQGSSTQFKYETVEEIWDMVVFNDKVYTVRDRDLTVSSIGKGQHKLLAALHTVEGRSPVCLCRQNHKLCLVTKDGLALRIYEDDGHKYPLMASTTPGTRIINALCSSPDESRIYSGGWDSTLQVWDAQSAERLGALNVGNVITSVATTEEGVLYVGGENGYLAKLKVQ